MCNPSTHAHNLAYLIYSIKCHGRFCHLLAIVVNKSTVRIFMKDKSFLGPYSALDLLSGRGDRTGERGGAAVSNLYQGRNMAHG